MDSRSFRTAAAAFALLATPAAKTLASEEKPAMPNPVAPAMGSSTYSLRPSVQVKARDGVSLSTDIYLPDGAGPFPVIMIRTPYNKNLYRPNFQKNMPRRARTDLLAAQFYVSHGYAVVVQDFRGRWETGGAFEAFRGRSDFADTAKWLESQPWFGGRIGMNGCSYVGESQVLAAASNTPSLKAITPMAQAGGFSSALGRYTNTYYYTGGARELGASIPWYLGDGSHLFLKPDPNISPEIWAKFMPLMTPGPKAPEGFDLDKTYRSLPLLGMTDRAQLPPNDWNLIAGREAGDAYFTNQSELVQTGDKLHAPGLWFNSWNDANPGETIDAFNYARAHAGNRETADNQYLVIGPGYHCSVTAWADGMKVGDLKLPRAGFDVWGLMRSWNDRWVKNLPNAMRGVPRVSYYLMGKDEWRTASDFPIPGTRETNFYLSGDKGLLANIPKINGKAGYSYDPANPVVEPMVAFSSPVVDRREMHKRPDVLVFATPPLKKGVTVVGKVRLELFISSSATDTDFTANLIDIHPDGRAISLQNGILRARFRGGMERPELMVPGTVYPLTIDLQAIGNWFAPGHRIAVEISSSNFPRFDRNLNTGGDNGRESTFKSADNTVHFGAATPSRLVLPVLPER